MTLLFEKNRRIASPALAPTRVDFEPGGQTELTIGLVNNMPDSGLKAEKLFEERLERDIHFVNDADAAGFAENRFGAAKDSKGLTIMTTLGTGIGTALIYNGVLIPNAEIGHLEIDGVDYETMASFSAKERDDLDWEAWAERLQRYYSKLEDYFSPDLFVVGGGVSKEYKDFLPLLDLKTPIVPAKLRNNAGIMGAATLAAEA